MPPQQYVIDREMLHVASQHGTKVMARRYIDNCVSLHGHSSSRYEIIAGSKAATARLKELRAKRDKESDER